MTDAARPSIRIDKWLWHARFFKTRTLAASVVAAGKVRVDGTPVSKTSRAVSPDMVLTFVKEGEAKVVRILACGERRGPAPEAQSLYEDLSPEPEPRPMTNPGYEGKGRPNRKDRENAAAFDPARRPFDLE